MTDQELRQYQHPKEPSRFVLALVFAIPVSAVIVILVVVTYGLGALLIAGILLTAWIGYEVAYAGITANSIRVSKENYPRVLEILEELKERLGVAKHVDVFIYEQGEFNAYFKRFFRRRSVFVNSELLEQGVKEAELRWVIGRFVGRIRTRERFKVFSAMITLAEKLVFLNLFLFPYERATAYTGDRMALACIDGDVTSAVSAMNKLLVGRSLGYSVNPAGLVDQGRQIQGGLFSLLSRLLSSMPHTVPRYVDLIGFARQKFPDEFQQFIAENPSFEPAEGGAASQGEAAQPGESKPLHWV